MGYAVLRWFYVIVKQGGRDQLGAHQQHEGVQGVSPWHTTLLARYSVLYLPATGVRKRGRKVGQSALYHGLEKGTGAGRYTKSGQAT